MEKTNLNKIFDLKNYKILKTFKGGNSKVIMLKSPDNLMLAAKCYEGSDSRRLKMVERELFSINFLNSKGFKNIPTIIGYEKELGVLIYEWIDGSHPESDKNALEAILEMNSNLFHINQTLDIFVDAIDAAHFLNIIYFQIQNRVLMYKREMRSKFVSEYLDLVTYKLNTYKKLNLRNIQFKTTTLSFSDLGVHNIILSDKTYYFIDFEFFGKDSVSKMVGDFVLHPKNNFEPELINYFIDSVSCSFNWKSDELILILPPLCLKWSLIVLKQTLKKFRSDTENVNIQDLLNQSMSKKYLDYFDFLIANPNFERYTSFTNYISKQ